MIIRNASLFLNDRFQQGPDVRIHNGTIQEIGHSLECGLYETIQDLAGDYLLPGFVDVHIHAFRGHDTMAGEDAVRHMSADLFRYGVSAFCPTTMSASMEDTLHAIRGIRAVKNHPGEHGARVLGAHMEAPFLQPKQAGAQKVDYFLKPSMDSLLEYTGNDLDIVRLITVAPELEGAESFIREAVGKGIRVSVGHTSATAETVHAAGDWGADHITHTFNAQTPIHHRAPGVPGAALTDSRFYCEMICDGVHLHRDTVRLIALCKGESRAVAITDAMEAASMPDGIYELGGQKVIVKGNEARLQDGTLAGSVLTMPQALSNLIHLFDVPPEKAVRMCTATPADSIGEHLAGHLTVGSPAPLTRWSQDWKMRDVLY